MKAQHLTAVKWLGRACGARVKGLGLKSKNVVFGPGWRAWESESSQGLSEGYGGGGAEEGEGDLVRGVERLGLEGAEAEVMEKEDGSIEVVTIQDGYLDPGFWDIRQTTPGSVNLVFQAILPFLLFDGVSLTGFEASATQAGGPPATITVRIIGGTNVSNSPSYEYFDQVLFPVLEKIGIPRIGRELVARGWAQGAPMRLGCVQYTVTPLTEALPAFQLTERGDIESVHATVLAPAETESQFRDMLEDEVSRYRGVIFGGEDAGDIPLTVSFEDSKHAKRYYVLLVATTTTGMKLGRDLLYSNSKGMDTSHTVKHIVRTVTKDLITEIQKGGCVDEHLKDQLIVFQALAEGRCRVYPGKEVGSKGRDGELATPNLHAATAMWVVSQMVHGGSKWLKRWELVWDEEDCCVGLGFVPGRGVPPDGQE